MDVASLSGRVVRVGLVVVVRFFFYFLIINVGAAGVARADFAADLVRIHAEAVGGREQVNALKSLKATGVTRGEGGDLRFIIWAERPNRIRTEITSGDRTILQAWDGRGAPWRADSKKRQVVVLRGEAANEIKVEAEFDDPLLAGPDRKVALDYVGVVDVDGRKLIRLFVTHNFTATSSIYVDPLSYLIVRREAVRDEKGVGSVTRTDYEDYRPVAGVLMPHRLVTFRDGKRLHETLIEHIEANPRLAPGFFELPAPSRD